LDRIVFVSFCVVFWDLVVQVEVQGSCVECPFVARLGRPELFLVQFDFEGACLVLEDRVLHLLEQGVDVCQEGCIGLRVVQRLGRVDFVDWDLIPFVPVAGVGDRIVDLDLLGPFSGLVEAAYPVVEVANPVPRDMCLAFHRRFLVSDRVHTAVLDRRAVLDRILVMEGAPVDRTHHLEWGKCCFLKAALAGRIAGLVISVAGQVLDRVVVVEEVDHQEVWHHPVEVAHHVHSSWVEDLSFHHIAHDLIAVGEVHFGPNFADHREVQTLFVEELNQS
jgi:hypothetical protein